MKSNKNLSLKKNFNSKIKNDNKQIKYYNMIANKFEKNNGKLTPSKLFDCYRKNIITYNDFIVLSIYKYGLLPPCQKI